MNFAGAAGDSTSSMLALPLLSLGTCARNSDTSLSTRAAERRLRECQRAVLLLGLQRRGAVHALAQAHRAVAESLKTVAGRARGPAAGAAARHGPQRDAERGARTASLALPRAAEALRAAAGTSRVAA